MVFSLSCPGLQQHPGMKYNPTKAVFKNRRTKEEECLKFLILKWSDKHLRVSNKVKYLGHSVTEQMTDERDIYRQCCVIFVQTTILPDKFDECRDEGRVSLLKGIFIKLYNSLYCSFVFKFQKGQPADTERCLR